LSVEDPKTTLMNLIKNNIVLPKDDNITPATVHVSQEWFNSQLFKDFDAQITIGLADGSMEKLNVGGSWVRHNDHYRLTGWSIDKTGITGKELRWKIRREIERIIRANRKNPGGSLSFVDIRSVSESEDANSKPPYWKVEVMVATHRYVKAS
jgi:hypothetical protein